MLLYIHGFNSSPGSQKAVLVRDYLARHHPDEPLAIPRLETSPEAAMAQLERLVRPALAAGEPLRMMGSSLGGYFASYLAENCGGRAVLINPAVRPYELLLDYLGLQENPYTGERYRVTEEHMAQLKALDTPVIRHPDRFLALLQSGDEVLDYRQGVDKYHHCQMVLESGGDHSFVGFDRHLAGACRFLGLA
ncbi:esterase YqiA [Ferrimonas sediminicola]|uniref:Esterase YqiA n=1 Tax=Ferrimonas sediminicola TaxID=2569538 RepID=A0A4U1BJ67_9GAMM|nr:YqiA/YcfP family alpha/beta fold hydrolase [Ferrimonas sediminicola]TKB51413.1 esterase YqiA [Ferrimonas sediminicola]